MRVKQNPRKCMKKYTKDDLQLAVEKVKSGWKVGTVSKLYFIPYMTLRDRCSGKSVYDRGGHPTTLPRCIEEEIVKQLKEMYKKGSGVTTLQLVEVGNKLCKKMKIKVRNGQLTRRWKESLARRWPDLLVSKVTNLSTQKINRLVERILKVKELHEVREVESKESFKD